MKLPAIISGKKPFLSQKVFVTMPTLPSIEEVTPMLARMLKTRWVTNFGDFHNQLQDKIKELTGVKYALLCCNATIGLLVLLKTLPKKEKIITTPFTFPGTIHAIQMAGFTPCFCDISLDSFTLDPECVKSAIDSRVAAILAVNVLSDIVDVEAMQRIGKSRGIPVLYDSAHAFLARYRGTPVANFGRAEVFSFHGTKLFTTLEGGAITTNDKALYQRLRLLINCGIKDAEHVAAVGINAKMSEASAIFGLLSLKKRHFILRRLRNLASMYRKRLSGVPGIKFQQIRKGFLPNNQYMAIRIQEDKFGLSRDELYRALTYDNVFARKYFFPLGHHYDCYRDKAFAKAAILPNAQIVAKEVLCLPQYPLLEESKVGVICDLIEACRNNAGPIRKKLRARR